MDYQPRNEYDYNYDGRFDTPLTPEEEAQAQVTLEGYRLEAARRDSLTPEELIKDDARIARKEWIGDTVAKLVVGIFVSIMVISVLFVIVTKVVPAVEKAGSKTYNYTIEKAATISNDFEKAKVK